MQPARSNRAAEADSVPASQPAAATAAPSGRWFSANPSKAWGEKFFLCYFPFFFALNASKQIFGLLDVGTAGHLAQNIGMLAPLYLYPAIFRDESALGRSWYQTYWFKMNLWIYIFAFAGTYFFTEYFFDVLGMVYHFPKVSLFADAALVGTGEYRVPLGMYFNAAAFFVIYHTVAIVLMRRVRTSSFGGSRAAIVLTTVVAAYFFAWAETFLIARDANSTSFYYKDLSFMLKYGSMFYGSFFIVSFPMAYRIDEEPTECWTVGRTIIDALAASMIVFFLLDFQTHFFR